LGFSTDSQDRPLICAFSDSYRATDLYLAFDSYDRLASIFVLYA
jgi:hypothetical protein